MRKSRGSPSLGARSRRSESCQCNCIGIHELLQTAASETPRARTLVSRLARYTRPRHRYTDTNRLPATTGTQNVFVSRPECRLRHHPTRRMQCLPSPKPRSLPMRPSSFRRRRKRVLDQNRCDLAARRRQGLQRRTHRLTCRRTLGHPRAQGSDCLNRALAHHE